MQEKINLRGGGLPPTYQQATSQAAPQQMPMMQPVSWLPAYPKAAVMAQGGSFAPSDYGQATLMAQGGSFAPSDYGQATLMAQGGSFAPPNYRQATGQVPYLVQQQGGSIKV
jgi:hypothetical protein